MAPELTLLPESALLEKPFVPTREQLVASALDQLRRAESPLITRIGLAVKEPVGAGGVKVTI
jgi:hypothetical protein